MVPRLAAWPQAVVVLEVAVLSAEQSTPSVLPEFILSPDESWWCAITETRDEAVRIFGDHWGELPGGPNTLTEIRLIRAPVPEFHQDEFEMWFEKHPDGDIIGWEIQT